MNQPSYFKNDDALIRWWDQLCTGQHVDPPSDLDPLDREMVIRLHALDDQPHAGMAFRDQLWRELMSSETGFASVDLLPGAARPRGRITAVTHESPASRKSRAKLGRALNVAGALGLVAAVLVLIFVTFGGRNNGFVPPVQVTSSANENAPAGEWLTLRGDMGRSGSTDAVGPKGDLQAKWVFKAGAALASPIKVGDRVFVTSEVGVVYSLDAATGEERWSFDTKSRAAASFNMASATSDGTSVFVGSASGDMYAFNGTDGTILWQVSLPAGVSAPAVIVDDAVIVVDVAGTLHSLGLTDGQELWSSNLGFEATQVGISYADGQVFAGTDDGKFFGVDSANGSILWTRTFGAPARTATVTGDYVLMPATDGIFRAIDARTGEDRWTVTPPDGLEIRACSVKDGIIVANIDGNSTVGLDLETGTQVWSYKHESQKGIAIGRETAYLATDDGGVIALDLASGTEVGRGIVGSEYGVGASVVEGMLYVPTFAGDLIAFETGIGTPVAPVEITPKSTGVEPTVSAATPTVQTGVSGTLLWTTEIVEGTLQWDDGVAIGLAPNGDVWVLGNPVKIYDRDGAFKETWGTMGEGPGELNWKMDVADGWWGGIAFAPDGSFWIANCGNERVDHFSADRRYLDSFGKIGSGPGDFKCPADIVIAPNGDLIVSDLVANRVQRFAADGTFIVDFGIFQSPVGLSIDANGNVLVQAGPIYVVGMDGTKIGTFGTAGPGPDEIHMAYTAEVSSDGYVVVNSGEWIQFFAEDGSPIGTVSLVDLTGDPSTVSGPIRIAGNGSLYIVLVINDTPVFGKIQLKLPSST